MNIRVILEWDDAVKAYSATCPELNFVSSCGESKEEAVSNLKEAIALLLTPISEDLLQTSGPFETVDLAL
jgi:predicted RNase H-like HicB family nuclease